MKPFLVPVLLSFYITSADTATQTDWSGGAGVPGPAGSWSNTFSSASGIDWSIQAGQITIIQSMVEHVVTTGSVFSPLAVASADIDGDGDVDVACAGEYLRWCENADGSGVEWIERTISESAEDFVALDDVDGDGDVDVLGVVDYAVTWWENSDGTGTDWTEHTIGSPMSRPVGPVAGDVDGDGDEDVMCANFTYNDGKIYWWENLDGSGTAWTMHQITGGSGGYLGISRGDVDSDGDMDILGAAVYGCDVIWFENTDGTGGSWLMQVVDDQFDSSLAAYPADMDGDGDADVLGAGTGEDAVTWWENLDGSGSSWQEHIVAAIWSYTTLFPDDLDGDGDIDILAADGYGNRFLWFENTGGSGTAWEEHLVCEMASSVFTSAVCADDFDGNASMDFLGALTWVNCCEVRWWDLDPTEGALVSSILYTGCDPDWGILLWSDETPPGTAIGFQVRASDDPASMGAWSDTLWAPSSLQGILADNASYLQYRAILTTTDPEVTPVLQEVTVTWNPLGTGGGEAPQSFQLLPVTPNPCAGSPSIRFGLPGTGCVEILLFDVSGRLVGKTGPVEYEPGWQAVQLGEMPPGVYFVRMRAGEYEAAERFVVLE